MNNKNLEGKGNNILKKTSKKRTSIAKGKEKVEIKDCSVEDNIPPVKKGKGQGKTKVEIKYIDNYKSRISSQSKRSMGLIKSGHELCELTGSKLFMLIEHPSGKQVVYSSCDKYFESFTKDGLRMTKKCKRKNMEYATIYNSADDQNQKITEETITSHTVTSENVFVITPINENQNHEAMEETLQETREQNDMSEDTKVFTCVHSVTLFAMISNC